MNIYYIDYENVSSQGLKGVEALTENDEVILLYSKKADNVKIDILTTMMASKARIRFLPVHVGTPNALDFQLVTLLFLNYRPEDYCYIISKDSGYDCCIKTAAENGAPNVARYPNIESAVNRVPVKKTRRGRRPAQDSDAQAEQAHASAHSPADKAPVRPKADTSAQEASADSRTDGSRYDATADSKAASSHHDASADSKTASSRIENEGDAVVSQETAPVAADDGVKKKPARKRGRKKASQTEAENAAHAVKDNAPDAQAPEENIQAHDDASEGSQHAKNHKADKAHDSEKPQEHVLQQRYLSKQFEPKMQPSSGSSPKQDSDRPVSILSVIRRRNDVQLDMHQIDLIREALKSSGNKQQFYSYFVKKLGQKQGIELYHSIKSSYTDLVNANLQ